MILCVVSTKVLYLCIIDVLIYFRTHNPGYRLLCGEYSMVRSDLGLHNWASPYLLHHPSVLPVSKR